jgi:hypothetical protein
MALSQKRLGGPSQLTASSAIYYTVPSATTTIVKQIILANTTASAKTVTVRLYTSGTENNTFDILSAVSIAANETIAFSCSMVMAATETVKAFCSSSTSVNIAIFGIEET